MANTAKRVALYAAVGPELTHYEVDVDAATLTRRTTIELPANIHYCWPHASKPILYAATSDSASGVGGFVGSNHHVSALTLDRATGAPSKHGAPISLPTRPIHMTTDIPSEHILVAFSNPSGLRVYRVNPDGTPGAEGRQARGAGRPAGIRLPARPADERGSGCAQWRVRVRAAASRFPPDQTLGLRLAGAAEPARRVRISRRDIARRAGISGEYTGGAREYPRPSGGRHRQGPPERTRRLCRQSRLDGARRRLCRRREFTGRVRDRPGKRRTDPGAIRRHA